jgi:hypothetical protein
MVPDTSAATVTKSHAGPQRRRNSEATPRCRGPCTRKPTEISGRNPITSLEKVLKIHRKRNLTWARRCGAHPLAVGELTCRPWGSTPAGRGGARPLRGSSPAGAGGDGGKGGAGRAGAGVGRWARDGAVGLVSCDRVRCWLMGRHPAGPFSKAFFISSPSATV